MAPTKTRPHMSRLAKLARGYSISSELTYTFAHIQYRISQFFSEHTGLDSRNREARGIRRLQIGPLQAITNKAFTCHTKILRLRQR